MYCLSIGIKGFGSRKQALLLEHLLSQRMPTIELYRMPLPWMASHSFGLRTTRELLGSYSRLSIRPSKWFMGELIELWIRTKAFDLENGLVLLIVLNLKFSTWKRSKDSQRRFVKKRMQDHLPPSWFRVCWLGKIEDGRFRRWTTLSEAPRKLPIRRNLNNKAGKLACAPAR